MRRVLIPLVLAPGLGLVCVTQDADDSDDGGGKGF
jgi:hypothetical protein